MRNKEQEAERDVIELADEQTEVGRGRIAIYRIAEGYTPELLAEEDVRDEDYDIEDVEPGFSDSDALAEAAQRAVLKLRTPHGRDRFLMDLRSIRGKDRKHIKRSLEDYDCRKCLRESGWVCGADEKSDAWIEKAKQVSWLDRYTVGAYDEITAPENAEVFEKVSKMSDEERAHMEVEIKYAQVMEAFGNMPYERQISSVKSALSLLESDTEMPEEQKAEIRKVFQDTLDALLAEGAIKKIAEDEEEPLTEEELVALNSVVPACSPKERYDQENNEGYI
jgi:hypothetical protein